MPVPAPAGGPLLSIATKGGKMLLLKTVIGEVREYGGYVFRDDGERRGHYMNYNTIRNGNQGENAETAGNGMDMDQSESA